MKKLFVFVPVIILVLFLINSFVLKEKDPFNIGFKSTDGGKTWQDISSRLPEIKESVKFSTRGQSMVESDGVLVATGQKGIRRSTDNGKNWEWVIREGGVGIAIEQIEGGFAAITYSSITNTRRVRISQDSGKTWQAIDGHGLRPALDISSIKQIGKHLIVGHPDGVFQSSDMGKTWNKVHDGIEKEEPKFVMPWGNKPVSEGKKVFKIHVSGNELYAFAVSAGC